MTIALCLILTGCAIYGAAKKPAGYVEEPGEAPNPLDSVQVPGE